MADASLPLQGAIFAALTAAPPIGAPVYDAVPQNAGFPHIEISDGLSLDWSAALLRGEDHRIDIHVWSRYRGAAEVKTLMGAIKDRLHERPLTVAGFGLVDIRFSDAESMVDADGLTRHGTIRFRAMTTKD